MAHLFTYGTLMHPEIWNSLITTEYVALPFTIYNYVQRRLQGRHYPGLIPKKNGIVTGILYSNLNVSDLKKLDDFEGEEYQRIMLPLSATIDVPDIETYLYIGDKTLILGEDWDFDLFIKNNIDDFRAGFQGWRTLK